MALSDDQRAMLRLLAQREQGYEDMAALMGVSVEELRGRVKDALAQLEREGEEAPELPEPPAAPKAAPAAPEPPIESEPPELSASPPSGQIPPTPTPPPPSPGDRKPGLSLASKGAKIGIAAILAAVAIVVVLLLVLGGGDSKDSSTATTTAAESGATTAESEAVATSAVQEAEEAAEASSGKKEVTKAILEGDSEAHGIAIFGRVKNKLALQFVAEGLEQLPKGQSYAIWIAASPQKMLPLAISPVNSEGKIASQFEVATELLGYLATEVFDEIAVTRISTSKLNAALKVATKKEESPSYTGTEVMRGEITGPIVGAAKRIEEEEEAKGAKGGE